MSIRIQAGVQKDVEGCGFLSDVVRSPAAEGGRVVKYTSDGDEVLGLGLFIDWRLRAIRHTYVIKPTGVNPRKLLGENRRTAMDSIAFSTLKVRINRGISFN